MLFLSRAVAKDSTAWRPYVKTPLSTAMSSVAIIALYSLGLASASSCSQLDTCSACVQYNALDDSVTNTSCYWCAEDDEGSRCHHIGSIGKSKCFGLLKDKDCIASPTTRSTCTMKSPDFCPEATPQIRVSKGLMSRPYNSVRVSLISPSEMLDEVRGFDYNAKFGHAWKQLALSSKLVQLRTGQSVDVPFRWMHGDAYASIHLPKQGDGVTGLMIADPCVYVGLGAVPGMCTAGNRFKTADRIPEFTNAVMAAGNVSYWATLGDNWYDPTGKTSQTLYAKYSKQTLQALNVVVPGNHDYWSFEPKVWPSPYGEQCGNGFMQFNGMDSMAAKALGNGSKAAPYNLSNSIHLIPGEGLKCVAAQDNMNFYQQIGNVAIIGYTGASTYAELTPFFEEACAAVGDEPTISVVFLLSHWDTAKGITGGHNDSTTPGAFSRVVKLKGCKQFHEKAMFKWVTGHTHCNTINPYIDVWGKEVAQAGFRISGQGMNAPEDTCRVDADGHSDPKAKAQPNFGFPIFDTTGGRLRILYFDATSDDKYTAALRCVQQSGWRKCEHHATVWLDTPIVHRDPSKPA